MLRGFYSGTLFFLVFVTAGYGKTLYSYQEKEPAEGCMCALFLPEKSVLLGKVVNGHCNIKNLEGKEMQISDYSWLDISYDELSDIKKRVEESENIISEVLLLDQVKFPTDSFVRKYFFEENGTPKWPAGYKINLIDHATSMEVKFAPKKRENYGFSRLREEEQQRLLKIKVTNDTLKRAGTLRKQMRNQKRGSTVINIPEKNGKDSCCSPKNKRLIGLVSGITSAGICLIAIVGDVATGGSLLLFPRSGALLTMEGGLLGAISFSERKNLDTRKLDQVMNKIHGGENNVGVLDVIDALVEVDVSNKEIHSKQSTTGKRAWVAFTYLMMGTTIWAFGDLLVNTVISFL